jgi:hypothetical protein
MISFTGGSFSGQDSRFTSCLREFESLTAYQFQPVAQPGSASDLGSEGRWFEPSSADQFLRSRPTVRTLGCGPGNDGSNPSSGTNALRHPPGSSAVEHATDNREGDGSRPSPATTLHGSSVEERAAHNGQVASSILARATNMKCAFSSAAEYRLVTPVVRGSIPLTRASFETRRTTGVRGSLPRQVTVSDRRRVDRITNPAPTIMFPWRSGGARHSECRGRWFESSRERQVKERCRSKRFEATGGQLVRAAFRSAPQKDHSTDYAECIVQNALCAWLSGGAPDYESGGRRFDPCRARQILEPVRRVAKFSSASNFEPVAERFSDGLLIRGNVGSIPTRFTNAEMKLEPVAERRWRRIFNPMGESPAWVRIPPGSPNRSRHCSAVPGHPHG